MPKSEAADPPGEDAATRLWSPYSAGVSFLFIALWLLPILYVGSFRQSVPFLPRYLKDLQSVACLFPDEVRAWSTYHAEAQLGGSREWVELDLEDYFHVEIFGYRKHVSRMLGHSYAKRSGVRRVEEIAHHMRREYEGQGASRGELLALRFVRARHAVKDLAQQEGRFRRRPLAEIPWAKLTRFGEVRFDGRRPTWDIRGRERGAQR